MRDGGPARDGEAGLVIVHEEMGILVLEVKSGTPSHDHVGRWWIGGRELDRGPSTQARDSKYQLVLDAEALESPEAILAPIWALRRLVRGRIEDGKAQLLAASREQALILNRSRRLRRLKVVGPAGSGKSMLAAEKARRLAREGYRTLLICFNQRLATSLIYELKEVPTSVDLDVSTFHRLCERFGAEAGVLPRAPSRSPGLVGRDAPGRARSGRRRVTATPSAQRSTHSCPPAENAVAHVVPS